MSAISAITTTAKKLAGKPLSVASKTLAVATTAAVIYDCHVNGKQTAWSENQRNMSSRLHNQYIQCQTMSKDSPSLSKAKDIWFDTQQKFTIFECADNVKGYTKGVFKTIKNNLHLIGLSFAALKFKKVGKAAGCLLILNALKTLSYDVLGIGTNKEEL